MTAGGNMLDNEQLESIYERFELTKFYFTWQMQEDGDNSIAAFMTEYIEEGLYGSEVYEKVLALMVNNGINFSDAEDLIDDEEYFVLTDDEADTMARYYGYNYFDDIILPEVPEYLHRYIDQDSWVEDYLQDGRGGIIARYDGVECTQEINSTTYYIYRH